MKNLLLMFMAIAMVTNVNAIDTSKATIYADTSVYFVPKTAKQSVKEIVTYKVWPSGYEYEFHSTKIGDFDNLQPGGFWDLELAMDENHRLNVLFYIKDKSKPLFSQSIDVSGLAISSHVLYVFDEGQIQLNVVPKVHPGLPENIPLTADNFGLDHLCFNRSAVILDESFYLGQFTGFGERLVVGVPELNHVELSLKPLKDWKPIGTYLKGTIHIELDDNHLLKLMRVGVGPSGYENGGPFIVYGTVGPSKTNKEQTLEDALYKLNYEYKSERWQKYLDTLIEAKKMNPYVAISAGTIGTNYFPPIQLENAIGSIGTGQKCGALR